MEGARHKRLHTVQIHSHDVLEQVRLIYSDRKRISDFPMLGVEMQKGTGKISGGDIDLYIFHSSWNNALKSGQNLFIMDINYIANKVDLNNKMSSLNNAFQTQPFLRH